MATGRSRATLCWRSPPTRPANTLGLSAATTAPKTPPTKEPPKSSSARPAGWRTASIWRYDTTGNAQPSGLTSTAPSLPAKPGVVSFAFFTSPECKVQCSAVPDAQPDVNLSAAAKQIATYAAQPGGPAFAMLGGNAVGPLEHEKGAEPAADFARLPELLAPLGGLPTFAAIGRSDQPYETPFSEAFAEAPEPFGTGAPAGGIAPVSSGSADAERRRSSLLRFRRQPEWRDAARDRARRRRRPARSGCGRQRGSGAGLKNNSPPPMGGGSRWW